MIIPIFKVNFDLSIKRVGQIEKSNSSSCYNCGRFFYTLKEIKDFYQFCSNVCRFRYIYKTLAVLSENELLLLGKDLFSNKKDLVYSKSLLFDITKLMLKEDIATINLLAQGSAQDLLAQPNELISAQDIGSTTPYIRGEPMSRELSQCSEPAQSLSRQTKVRRLF